MERIINRRRLVAGAAALPIAAALPATVQAEHVTTPTKPDISEIPGLDQVSHVLCLVMVATPDGRMGTSHLAFHGFGDVAAIISTGDGDWHRSVVPGDGIESLPTWMQKNIGLTALTASELEWPR